MRLFSSFLDSSMISPKLSWLTRSPFLSLFLFPTHSLTHLFSCCLTPPSRCLGPVAGYLIGDIVHSYFVHPYKQLTNDSSCPDYIRTTRTPFGSVVRHRTSALLDHVRSDKYLRKGSLAGRFSTQIAKQNVRRVVGNHKNQTKSRKPKQLCKCKQKWKTN